MNSGHKSFSNVVALLAPKNVLRSGLDGGPGCGLEPNRNILYLNTTLKQPRD